jgi:hypothetical protein
MDAIAAVPSELMDASRLRIVSSLTRLPALDPGG